jgi:hypothetical protein
MAYRYEGIGRALSTENSPHDSQPSPEICQDRFLFPLIDDEFPAINANDIAGNPLRFGIRQ